MTVLEGIGITNSRARLWISYEHELSDDTNRGSGTTDRLKNDKYNTQCEVITLIILTK